MERIFYCRKTKIFLLFFIILLIFGAYHRRKAACLFIQKLKELARMERISTNKFFF